jgi:hypothetical protein
MNCQDFEAIAGDLSKDGLMDAGLREKGLEHCASCADCAARLEEERALTGGLRGFARASTEEAPSNVEAAVLSAFRQHQAGSPSAVTIRSSDRRWIYAAAGVAALVIIVTLLALNASRVQNPQPPEKAKIETPVKAGETTAVSDPPKIPTSEQKPLAMITKAQRVQHRGVTRQRPSQQQLNPNVPTEIATEFIPLTNREALAQMDGGQIMRVELPRSALMSFGLPMDMERATERIKADVVVGNDGLARAIRFVR